MDVDQPAARSQSAGASEQRINAQAGPSSQPDVPAVFLPPPGPSKRKPLFDSTQDLISRFQLLPVYDKYVRPFAHPVGSGEPQSKPTPASAGAPTPGGPFQAPTPGALDKGKGKEVPVVGTPRTPLGAPTPAAGDGGDGEDGDEDGGKGDKKKKSNYRHLIKGIPGKHSLKKDDYLQTIMLVPSKQKMTIAKLDLRTQREAFSVSLEGLKGWNAAVLVAESAQAREDRKKRKEAKKLAKAQAQSAQTGASLATPTQPISATTLSSSFAPPPPPSASSAPTPAPGLRRPQTPASVGVGTPRPQGPGPGPAHTNPGRPGTPAGMGPPRSATPRPGSVDALAKRGKKREHEDELGGGAVGTGIGQGAGQPQGQGQGQKRVVGAGVPPPGSGGVKAGGVPRPMKKARTDSTPHPMGLSSVPQQQPTPQGV